MADERRVHPEYAEDVDVMILEYLIHNSIKACFNDFNARTGTDLTAQPSENMMTQLQILDGELPSSKAGAVPCSGVVVLTFTGRLLAYSSGTKSGPDSRRRGQPLVGAARLLSAGHLSTNRFPARLFVHRPSKKRHLRCITEQKCGEAMSLAVNAGRDVSGH